MNWFSGTLVYIVIWWLTLFAVLPWGVRAEDNPQPGHADGAPSNPRIGLKFLVTTLIASALWGLAYWAVGAGLVDFRQM